MAAPDPNEIIGRGTFGAAEEEKESPSGVTLPDGYSKGDRGWYANWILYADGRRVVQWFRRGTGDGKTDPVNQETTDTVAAAREKFDEKVAKAKAEEEKAPPTRVINGVPHQVTGKDANGQDIWSPVQTASGPATPTSTARNQEWREEGTPDAQGNFDNNRLTMAEYINGKRTGVTRPPDDKELRSWNNAREMSRNPGGRTDAEIAAEKEKAAAASRPQVVSTNTTEPFIVTSVNGVLTSQPNPNYKEPPPKPGTTITVKGGDGKTYLIPVDANGNPGTPRDSGVPNSKPAVANAPKYAPDWNDPNRDLGLIAYAQQVRARADISWEDQNQLIKEAHEAASVASANVAGTMAAQEREAGRKTTERGQDVSMANQRLSASSANFGTAVNAAQADTKYSLGPEAGSVLPYYLAMGMGAAQAYGGLNTPPAVQLGPAAQQMQQMPGPWGQVNPQGVKAVTDNTNANLTRLTGQPTPPPAAAPQQVAAPSGPLFRPPPPVPGSTTVIPPVNPAAGQPGNNPSAPVGMTDMIGAGPWGQSPQAPTGAGAVAMQSAGGGYDPGGINRILQQAGIAPEVIGMFGGIGV